MKDKHTKIDRRGFLKTIGAAGLGSVFASAKASAGPNDPNTPAKAQEPKFPQVPKRVLGKTGVEVSSLALGTMFDTIENQIVLKTALKWGVNYWDTAHGYSGGNSEIGIGKYISKNPDIRKNLFIVSKAKAKSIAEIEEMCATSFKRMNTDYIDLYFGVHGLSDPAELTDELRRWVENAKRKKLIRFFGFSTHKNMAQCLMAASKVDWVDAIMTTYNFRLMQDAEMQAAIDACHKAGIGLVAMKTVALSSQGRKQLEAGGEVYAAEEEKKPFSHFMQQEFTEAQAKIKAVLEDKRISSACVGMKNVAILTSNVAAALDKTKLTQADMAVFKEYAQATCDGYCAGCAYICDSALPGMPYVSDIMRYLMYYNSYGEKDMARELFAQIPPDVRGRLLAADYSLAEARCPQHMPIEKLVAEAVNKLT
jgi:hypothetical protein